MVPLKTAILVAFYFIGTSSVPRQGQELVPIAVKDNYARYLSHFGFHTVEKNVVTTWFKRIYRHMYKIRVL